MTIFATIRNTILDYIFPETESEHFVRHMNIDDVRSLPTSPTHHLYISLWQYQHPYVKEIIRHIKYYEDDRIIHMASQCLLQKIRELVPLSKPTILIPMPMTHKRLRERGFNQIERLADAIVAHATEHDRISHNPHILTKITETIPQTHCTRKQRLTNMRHAFSVMPDTHIGDTHVILLDDVITTGSTMQEGVRALKAHGITHITCLALAH